MPGDSEHPVTLGDLRVPCEHGYYESHWVHTWPFHLPPLPFGQNRECDPRSATVADLVSALRAEGVLVIGRVPLTTENYGPWPKWAVEVLRYEVAALAEAPAVEILDALAEAQPFPPAGG